ncbi:MAG: DUF5615 family PIN-like protein [Candidatus Sumerlaeota bacterium]|nr:DUF5615 family PIN-like protein [Candidatus Sumerlaeota bacterium]
MSLAFYMDEQVHRAVSLGLRLRGVDVLTAQEDGFDGTPDKQLLERAIFLKRILFSQDDDLLREANQLQHEGKWFPGVVYCHQLRCTIGQIIDDLDLIAKAAKASEYENKVEYLPLS